jgi:DNA-binding NarL/FixJ family response regulator
LTLLQRGIFRFLNRCLGSAMTGKSSPNPETIRIGLLAAEPIRVAGLVSIFDLPAQRDRAQLVPVVGSLQELIRIASLQYVVVDLHASNGSLEDLETIRMKRPDIRSIVIGPEGDSELVLNAIVAGARAYLGLNAGPEVIRSAIDVVTSGSIWAPRRLLAQLIDRLLKVPKVTTEPISVPLTQLTQREQEVLELLVKAHSTREIAARLGIEQRTVKAYIGRLMKKTGADNRIKLSMSALNRSLVQHQGAGAAEHKRG